MPKAFLALTTCFVCVLAPAPSRVFDVDLASVGIRARVSSDDVLGKEQPEAFYEYDVWAAIRLPWQRYSTSDWGVGTRLLTSAGYLEGGGSSALVVSVIPVVALGTRDGRFTVDLGAGLAVLSQSEFAEPGFRRTCPGRADFRCGYSALPAVRRGLPVHALLRLGSLRAHHHRR